MSDKLKSGQTKQPHVEYPPEGNGWPEPLSDPSSPMQTKVTNGKSGSTESRRVEDTKTSFNLAVGE